MRILIACDMEGITGVTRWEHCEPDHAEYTRFRKLMTADVNAVIEGALDAGADEIFVADGHHSGQNLLIEELDERAVYNAGTSSPWSMMNGIDGQIDAVLFVGYHAKAGSAGAILAHTWSNDVFDLRINGQSHGEFGLNTLIAGYFSVPAIFVSGDQMIAQEATAFVPGIETAVVKQANGYFSGSCLPPEQTQRLLTESARTAVRNFSQSSAPKPVKSTGPVDIAVEFTHPHMAETAARMPGAERRSGRSVGITCQDLPQAFLAFRTLCNLGK